VQSRTSDDSSQAFNGASRVRIRHTEGPPADPGVHRAAARSPRARNATGASAAPGRSSSVPDARGRAAHGVVFARVERLGALGRFVVAVSLGLCLVLVALKLFVSHERGRTGLPGRLRGLGFHVVRPGRRATVGRCVLCRSSRDSVTGPRPTHDLPAVPARRQGSGAVAPARTRRRLERRLGRGVLELEVRAEPARTCADLGG
jgi:hypothetical protein